MKKLWTLTALAVTMLLLSPSSPAHADGKEVFIKAKCKMCHTVESQGIVKKSKSKKPADPDKKRPPDLSNVGTERDAEWLTLYLRKKTDIDGTVHKKRFKGKAEDLAVLADWLATLKLDTTKEGTAKE